MSISSEEIGINEPAILRLHPDAVVALVALARFDEAEQLTEQLDAATEANHHPWSTVMAARCHGLLKAANGDRCRGCRVARARSRRSSAAAHAFRGGPDAPAASAACSGEPAIEVTPAASWRPLAPCSLRLGTPIQARQASTELDSIGGRRRLENELTPVEQRIADLVAAGQTNREVAVATFTSVRTVESHLGRIYRKLGIRSRTELAARPPA